MTTLVTAVPGSGKTLFVVDMIVKAVADGRQVFADINGLQVDDPRLVTADGLKIERSPDDWRETPDGSLVIYDEAQRRAAFKSTGKPGRADSDIVRAMDMHRHSGHDIVFITQRQMLLHHELRGYVHEHYHLKRVANLPRATVWKWAECQEKPNDHFAKQEADSFTFNYPRGLYGLYKSASVHTRKIQIPKKLLVLGVAILLLFAFVGHKVYANGFVFRSADEPSHDQAQGGRGSASAPPAVTRSSDYDWLKEHDSPALGGCISSARDCRCYSLEGKLIDLRQLECRVRAEQPLPFGVRFKEQ